jgi:rare lipoprotein A
MEKYQGNGGGGATKLSGAGIAILLIGGGCVPMNQGMPGARSEKFVEAGMASWYGMQGGKVFEHGRKTASGARYDMNALTAAHKTLPLGTRVKVTNIENNKSIIVVINDRGPFVEGRIIDLTLRGARLLGFERKGLARVRVEALK